MIIKIIPENDIEKAKIKEEEHTGVKDFFMFGNFTNEDGELMDFQHWKASYRYLIGSLYYFMDHLSGEQKEKHTNGMTVPRSPSPSPVRMIKYGEDGSLQFPPNQSLTEDIPPIEDTPLAE